MVPPQYSLELDARVEAGPATYTFHTADGVCSTEAFRTPELLLVEQLWDAQLGELLCPAANYGVVGTILSKTADSVQLTETSARALQLCETNLRQNDATAATSLVTDLTTLPQTFDTVAYAPKPYTALEVAKQRIVDALAVLEPGGRLYLAAAKQTGLTRYESCLTETGASVETVATREEYRLLEATRAPAMEAPPTYVTPRTIDPTVDGVDLSLATVPGVFSAGGLDDGTRLLIEAATIEDGERVLDLCCGYGAIGVYAGQVADAEVWLSDDNAIATACARCSLRQSAVDGTVVTADCVDGVAGTTFDRVLCNPPTHAGDGVLSALFTGIHGILASDGVLTIVHHTELDLTPHLTRFTRTDTVRRGDEHVVLRVRP